MGLGEGEGISSTVFSEVRGVSRSTSGFGKESQVKEGGGGGPCVWGTEGLMATPDSLLPVRGVAGVVVALAGTGC